MEETYELALIRRGLRPFPAGNSLPQFIATIMALTRTPYEGEPREPLAQALPLEEEQYWAPHWVKIVVGIFSGVVDWANPNGPNMDMVNYRNHLLKLINDSPRRQKQLMDLWRVGGESAVAGLLGFSATPTVDEPGNAHVERDQA